MPTQWLRVATFAGASAAVVAARFAQWRSTPDPCAVDLFCATLRERASQLPIIYFAEWLDRWSMGDLVPGPGAVAGLRYQTACLTPEQALEWATQCGSQFAEQTWLTSRLHEAAVGWGKVSARHCVVVMREVIGPCTTDEEVHAPLDQVPDWLPRE